MAAHIVFDDGLEFFGYFLAFQRHRFFAVDVYRREKNFARTGQRDAILACLDSPGPLTTHPITATCMDSTPGYWLRHTGICVRKKVSISCASSWNTVEVV